METILIATNNQGKVQEIRELLSDFNIISLKEADIKLDVVEDGVTFSENAAKKAVEASLLTGYMTIADDSGLCVDSLNGRPGVYSARYSGDNATDETNNEKLLSELHDEDDRRAKFVCACALANGKDVIIKTGECKGKILKKSRGSKGFGYDPLFVPDGYDLTFAQLNAEIKNKISHRAKAFNLIKQVLASGKTD